MRTLHAEVLVIGWGKAGKTLAGKLAATGRHVALIERSNEMYGGTCINIACVPTKDLITTAETKRPGDDPARFFNDAVADRDALIRKLRAANHGMLEGKVALIDGEASFLGPHEVLVSGGMQLITVEAPTIIINTGTTPRMLAIEGADGPRVYDSTTIQHAKPFPKRLAVIGGGFIGL